MNTMGIMNLSIFIGWVLNGLSFSPKLGILILYRNTFGLNKNIKYSLRQVTKCNIFIGGGREKYVLFQKFIQPFTAGSVRMEKENPSGILSFSFF